jgi:hypothetical protein
MHWITGKFHLIIDNNPTWRFVINFRLPIQDNIPIDNISLEIMNQETRITNYQLENLRLIWDPNGKTISTLRRVREDNNDPPTYTNPIGGRFLTEINESFLNNLNLRIVVGNECHRYALAPNNKYWVYIDC